MKRILWIILSVSILAACKKTGAPPVPDSALIGKWELHERFGGNIYPADTIYQPGNGNVFQFNGDGTYKSYINGTPSRSGTYHTRIHISASMTAIRQDELYFDNETSYRYVFEINGNVLMLMPSMPDVATTDYDKIASCPCTAQASP